MASNPFSGMKLPRNTVIIKTTVIDSTILVAWLCMLGALIYGVRLQFSPSIPGAMVLLLVTYWAVRVIRTRGSLIKTYWSIERRR